MKKFIILLFAAVGSLLVSAQITHEFSIQGGGGLSTFNYKLSSGKRLYRGGGDVGISYTCFFIEKLGLRIGADIGFYNNKAELDGAEVITPGLVDSDNDRFDMYSTLKDYTETQKNIFLNIPVMAQFQTKKFYLMGGIKVGIPLSSKYSVSGNTTLTNKGYYTDIDCFTPTPEFAGFGTFKNKSLEEKIPFKVSVTLALEMGLRWKFGNHLALYAGLYFDYGLNNIIPKDYSFINYDASIDYSEVENHEKLTQNSALPSLTEKMNLMAAGLKLRFAFKYP